MLSATATSAALLSLLFIFLSGRVVYLRRKHKVGVGDGEVSALTKAIRCHGNFAEYVPLSLILLGLYEYQHAGDSSSGLSWSMIFGALLVISRLLHAWGLAHSKGTSFGRFYGTAINWLLIIVLSALVFINAIQ